MDLPGAHDFIRLSDGDCHYRLDGPAGAPLILLLHGATVSEWEFDLIRPYLLSAGFRTLSFDFYGHGYSDRPQGAYDLVRFARQAEELLVALAVEGPVDILAHSLGAAVAASFALRTPARAGTLLLAAPLLDFTANLPVSRVLRVPLVGELLARHYMVPMLLRRRAKRYGLLGDGTLGQRYRNQVLKPDFDRALLSLFRGGALDDQRQLYAALARSSHRICLLWGENDVILPAAQRTELADILVSAPVFAFPDTAHSFLLSHPERVAPAIITCLEETKRAQTVNSC